MIRQATEAEFRAMDPCRVCGEHFREAATGRVFCNCDGTVTVTVKAHNPRREAALDVVKSALLRALVYAGIDCPSRRGAVLLSIIRELDSRALRPYLAVLSEDD